MSEEDQSSKTEDPSGKKLSQAKQKGQVAQSQEIKSWGVLFGATLGLLFLAPKIAHDVKMFSYKFLERPHSIPVDLGHLQLMLKTSLVELGTILAPLMAFVFVLALILTVAQTGWTFSWEKMKLDPGKFSVIKGVKKIFGVRALVEFGKGLVKTVVVGIVMFFALKPLFADIALFPGKDINEALDRMLAIALAVAALTLLIMTVVSALDFAYQKYDHIKKLKMTKQEVKDENKQAEGDPKVKQRIARVRMERAHLRIMSAVPQADVIITNPTHFAVALEYKMDTMPAPKLVAKGMDELALRIRQVADEHGVPIVENPPLARALYSAVEIDEEIPGEHYAAVAEVIGYVFRLKGKLPSTPTPGGVHQDPTAAPDGAQEPTPGF